MTCHISGKNPDQQARNCYGAHGQPSGSKECTSTFTPDPADGEHTSVSVSSNTLPHVNYL